MGRGIGTEMRAAVVHLAFAGLDAEEAVSVPVRTTRRGLPSRLPEARLQPDGMTRHVIRGAMSIERRLRLARAVWERHRIVPVSIDGLTPGLFLLGVNAA